MPLTVLISQEDKQVPSAQGAQSGGDANAILAERSPPACGLPLGRTVYALTGAETDAWDGAKAAGAVAGRNVSIQCLRGLAALFVAMYHASIYAEMKLGGASWAAVFDGRFGLVGVAVFFAISGLLMADLVQRTDPWRFLGHRIVRIYPAFLLATAIVAVMALAGDHKLAFHGFSLLLVPAGARPYYLGVEWTLVFECTYYVALFLIALAGWQRHLTWIVLAWLVAIFAAPLVTGWNDQLLFHFYSLWLAPANVAFACGLLIPWIARNVRIPVGAGILACGILMVAPPDNLMIARWVAGAAAALLVLDATRIKAPPRAVTGLLTLGDWSYALYLVHVPTILVVYRLWPASADAGLAWLAAIAIALSLSAGFGMVDVRMYRRLRKAVDELSEEERRRRVNLYVGVFIVASLAGAVV
jgi:exopolysaccharide production protein ExoZ